MELQRADFRSIIASLDPLELIGMIEKMDSNYFLIALENDIKDFKLLTHKNMEKNVEYCEKHKFKVEASSATNQKL